MMNMLHTGNAKLNNLLSDRFEIETIRQEQGFFKQKLESIKNDIRIMKELQDHGKNPNKVYMQTMPKNMQQDRQTFLYDNGRNGVRYTETS